jgi:nucleosome binding factor SPN SPT16 subunit
VNRVIKYIKYIKIFKKQKNVYKKKKQMYIKRKEKKCEGKRVLRKNPPRYNTSKKKGDSAIDLLFIYLLTVFFRYPRFHAVIK